MLHLKDLKKPLLLSSLIFIVSIATMLRIDLYAALLTGSYFVVDSASNVMGRYFDLTRQKKSTKAALKVFLDPLGIFLLITGFFYALQGEFHWIFTGTAAFLTLLAFAVRFSDWYAEREKESGENIADKKVSGKPRKKRVSGKTRK